MQHSIAALLEKSHLHEIRRTRPDNSCVEVHAEGAGSFQNVRYNQPERLIARIGRSLRLNGASVAIPSASIAIRIRKQAFEEGLASEANNGG